MDTSGVILQRKNYASIIFKKIVKRIWNEEECNLSCWRYEGRMKFGDLRSVFTRLLHIINVSMSLLNVTDQPTDPTVLLPAGFGNKPSIRQGRAKYRNDNESSLFERTLSPPVVDTDLGRVEGYHMRVVSGRYIYAFEVKKMLHK